MADRALKCPDPECGYEDYWQAFYQNSCSCLQTAQCPECGAPVPDPDMMVGTPWRCAECGATGAAKRAYKATAFEVARAVIADHNATVTNGCQRRPDSLVHVGQDPVVIEKELEITPRA